MTDPLKRLPDMDEEGIDVAVIFGTSIALSVNGMADKPLAALICHAVNRWLVEEYLAPDPKRLKGVGLIPVQDPPAAVKELEYLAQHRQSSAPCCRPMSMASIWAIACSIRSTPRRRRSACRCRSIRRPSMTASTASGA